ncbi:MAG: hypothetical protein F4Z14_07590 [Gammaproteobacteria bacterium]|nr:hypothetical protein [Gammaproteobacteria bacterium]
MPQETIEQEAQELNHMPRKCLGFRTPQEFFDAIRSLVPPKRYSITKSNLPRLVVNIDLDTIPRASTRNLQGHNSTFLLRSARNPNISTTLSRTPKNQ